MINKQHPVTPSSELIDKWHTTWINAKVKHFNLVEFIAIQSAQWGADQELEACCAWFRKEGWNECHPNNLHAARRPKPLSLKEQALEAVSRFGGQMWSSEMESDLAVIHRALETLPND